jgi:hypothetical protein
VELPSETNVRSPRLLSLSFAPLTVILSADILGSTDQTTAISYITSQISTFNDSLKALNLDKTIPIGTADAGSVYTSTIATGVDEYLANVHPWFGGVNISDAAGWTCALSPFLFPAFPLASFSCFHRALH